MMLRYTLDQAQAADAIDAAVATVLKNGLRCQDIAADAHARDIQVVDTQAMGDAVLNALSASN